MPSTTKSQAPGDDRGEDREALEGREDDQADHRDPGERRVVAQGAEGDQGDGEHDVGDDRDGGVHPVGGSTSEVSVPVCHSAIRVATTRTHDRAERLEASGRRGGWPAAAAAAAPAATSDGHQPDGPVEAVGRRCRGWPRRTSPAAPCPRRRCARPTRSGRAGRRAARPGRLRAPRRRRAASTTVSRCRLVPQRLARPPADAGDDADEERQVAPGRGSRGARAPAAQRPIRRGLVGRHLQRLGGLEDHRAEGQRGHQPQRRRRAGPTPSGSRGTSPPTRKPSQRTATATKRATGAAGRGWRRPARSGRRRRSRHRGRAGPGRG